MQQHSKESNKKFLEKILKDRMSQISGFEIVKKDYDTFNISKICSDTLKDLLIKKYENIDCRSKDFKDRFGHLNFKQAFIKNYFEGEQPRCCFCGQILEETLNKNNEKCIIADIEHILPKSKFPQFALHPNNLAPCCKDCNEVIKGDSFFEETPFENFKTAINDLGLDINNLHPLKLWKHLQLVNNDEIEVIVNPNLSQTAKDFLNFYGIEKRVKTIFNRCYNILFNIIKHSDIRSPESLERLLENMASSNWHEINDGYSLNNSPQIWQEFIENILYDECKLMALWDEVKELNQFSYNIL